MRYIHFVSHLMVKTIDGNNDLWPRSQSGRWTALPHRCFISAPKIQSGILKLGYGAPLKNLEVLETPSQQPCVARSEVQEQLLRQTGGAFRALQPPGRLHLCASSPWPPWALGFGIPNDVIKVTDQSPPGKTNVCGGVGGRGECFLQTQEAVIHSYAAREIK